jgi:pimeloyl-ACP methyl ester carboxylesterase
MAPQVEPVDERIELTGGLWLRIVRWGATGEAVADSARAVGRSGAVESARAAEPPPFLLVHGLASNARLWDGVGRRLAEAGRVAVAVDLRGHGHSDKPDGGYDFATISQDLRTVIAALSPGFARPIVAGQSWGGNVVLDFAVRHPDLVRGIVLVDGGLTDLRDAFPTWDICWDRLAPPPLIGMPLSAVEGYFRTNHADWPEEGFEGSLGNFEIRPDRTIAPRLSREHHKAILEAMWGQRIAESWRSLRVPALIIPVDGGEGDWTSAKRVGVEAAEAATTVTRVPVRVRWFTGDHDIHAQHPAELVESILAAERGGLFAGSGSGSGAGAGAASATGAGAANATGPGAGSAAEAGTVVETSRTTADSKVVP